MNGVGTVVVTVNTGSNPIANTNVTLTSQTVFAGTLSGVTDAQPGSFATASVAGEPVAVVRGDDGELRALSNVCRHRAMQILDGAGRCPKVLRCPYHGWTYRQDGQLAAVPEARGFPALDREGVALPSFRVESLAGLVFVSLDRGAPPLREWFGDVAERLETLGIAGLKAEGPIVAEYPYNWKNLADNYLEGYHIPIVHPSLFRVLDYQRYRTETRGNYSIQHAPLRHGDDRAEYFWLYPNLMLNVYPDNFSTNLIVPLGPTRTLTLFEWYFHNPDAPDVQKRIDEQVAFSDEIQLEDIAICEAVQRGLASSTYDRGRFSPQRENGVHHFHGLYASSMADSPL